MMALAGLPPALQAAVAAMLAAVFVGLPGRRAVRWLAAMDHRQRIRDDAPARHQTKAGTPTMGGLLIIGGVIAAALLTAGLDAPVLFGVVALGGFGAIGLADDLRKVRLNRNLGLRARERLLLQVAVGLALGWWAITVFGATSVATPWDGRVELGWGYAGFAMLLVVGFANAVNLTDGLDGLAVTLAGIVAAGLGAVAVVRGQWSAAALAVAVVGGCAGFLPLNAHPAKVFMGDVGSNALGAALAALAIVLKIEMALLVIGGVFVAEAASVILQVAYFKATRGRRIFRMSPLHHHFELVGWSEPAIVRRFSWVGALCAAAGLVLVLG